MAKALSQRGSLPNGRPDRETMRFRYEMLKELQGVMTPEIIRQIAARAINDAIFGDETVVAAARNWLSQYTLPKVQPLANPDDVKSETNITNLVINMREEQLRALATLDLDAIPVESTATAIDATAALSSPDPAVSGG